MVLAKYSSFSLQQFRLKYSIYYLFLKWHNNKKLLIFYDFSNIPLDIKKFIYFSFFFIGKSNAKKSCHYFTFRKMEHQKLATKKWRHNFTIRNELFLCQKIANLWTICRCHYQLLSAKPRTVKVRDYQICGQPSRLSRLSEMSYQK